MKYLPKFVLLMFAIVNLGAVILWWLSFYLLDWQIIVNAALFGVLITVVIISKVITEAEKTIKRG